MERREFIAGSAAFIALASLNPFTKLAFAAGAESKDNILVYIFLRGGMDGLHLLAPASDADYQAARMPDLRVADSGTKAGLLLKNGAGGLEFRLHPSAAGFKDLYDNDSLAFVHASGLTHGTRSHFDAQDIIDKGLNKDKTTRNDGWLARYLNHIGSNGHIPAMSANASLPLSYLGYGKALSLTNPYSFYLNADGSIKEALADMYSGGSYLDKAARETLGTVNYLQGRFAAGKTGGQADTHEQMANYSPVQARDELAAALNSVARVINLDAGLKVATIDMGGWDTHDAQHGRFPRLMESLATSVSQFYNALSPYHNRLTIVIMSEFGRRLKANKSNGTDHGYGNVTTLIGNQLKGGKMYGQWPGLSNRQLNQNVDLNITTDYRAILSEVLTGRMALKHDAVPAIFPGFQPVSGLGLFG